MLPQAMRTRIMVTLNLRELLHIGCMRLRKEAQKEIRDVVLMMMTNVMLELGLPIPEMLKNYCKDTELDPRLNRIQEYLSNMR